MLCTIPPPENNPVRAREARPSVSHRDLMNIMSTIPCQIDLISGLLGAFNKLMYNLLCIDREYRKEHFSDLQAHRALFSR